MFNIITFTLLSLIVGTLGQEFHRSKRNLNSSPNNQGMSNMAPVGPVWFGPPLPGFPGYPGFPGFPGFPFFPPSAQQIMDQTNAQIAAIRNQISEQIKQNDCEPVEVSSEPFTVGGKNYTYIKKTCQVNGPNGSSSSSSSIITSDPNPSPTFNSGSSSSSSSSLPDSGSSSSSGTVSSSGPAASSSTSSGPNVGTGAYSSAIGGGAVASATST